VPYTEYLLYQDPQRNVALQNIGGIPRIVINDDNHSIPFVEFTP
jgi:hypothetical protein